MRFFSFLLLFLAFLNASEPSAFSAGDISSESAYGLTPIEQEVYNNKQEIKDVKNRLFQVESSLKDLQVSIEGLRSVFEGTMGKVANANSALAQDENRSLEQFKSVESALNQQNANIRKINTVLKELSSVVDNINGRYVSKDELDTVKKNSSSVKTAEKKVDSQKSDGFDPKDSFKLFDEAEAKMKKNELQEAKKRFEFTAKNNYKPAMSNFYLGEIAFKTKDYKNAVAYYKSSAEIYDKADYMPTLLLNLGTSLDKLGDKKNARIFLQSLVDSFPDSSEAKEAEQILK